MAYRGMKWVKCDLQVQTPANAAHWLGAAGSDAAAATAFIARCYEAGLGCVTMPRPQIRPAAAIAPDHQQALALLGSHFRRARGAWGVAELRLF